MGGVLRYKFEVHCSTNWRCTAAFPFLQSLEASEAQRQMGARTALQIGGVLPVVFREVVRVGGSYAVPINPRVLFGKMSVVGLDLWHSSSPWTQKISQSCTWVSLPSVLPWVPPPMHIPNRWGGTSTEQTCPRRIFGSIRKMVWKRIRKMTRNISEDFQAPPLLLKNISLALL